MLSGERRWSGGLPFTVADDSIVRQLASIGRNNTETTQLLGQYEPSFATQIELRQTENGYIKARVPHIFQSVSNNGSGIIILIRFSNTVENPQKGNKKSVVINTRPPEILKKFENEYLAPRKAVEVEHIGRNKQSITPLDAPDWAKTQAKRHSVNAYRGGEELQDDQ